MVHRTRSPIVLAVLACLVALLLAACSTGPEVAGEPGADTPQPSGEGTVRVGSGERAESWLLAEIYAQGLAIRGVEVERSFGTGDGGASLPALTRGEIDLVPEYTGGLLRALDPRATVTEPEAVYAEVARRLPPSLTLLEPAAAQSAGAVVVTRALAERYRLGSIEDLVPLCPAITFGGPPDLVDRPAGAPGLARLYGCVFREVRALDAGGPPTVAALRDGSVQAAGLVTTDPAVADDLVALSDPLANFAAQNVVPLVRRAKTEDPRVIEVLDRISSALDTSVLTDLNRRLAAPDRPDPALVARSWLASAGVG